MRPGRPRSDVIALLAKLTRRRQLGFDERALLAKRSRRSAGGPPAYIKVAHEMAASHP
jgi:hypothetical protein